MKWAWPFALAVLAIASPAAAHNSCVEVSDVVGDRVCGRYGNGWSTERTFPLSLAAGFWMSHVEPRGRTWHGSPEKSSSNGFGVAGSQMGMSAVDLFGVDFRFLGHPSAHTYLGIDWAFAMGAVDSAVAPTEGYSFRDAKGPDFVHARTSFVLGGRIPLGRLSLRAETLIGLDVASLSVEVQKGDGQWTRGSITSVGLLLEPRVACDLWTGPWSTVSVWGGTNFLHPNDRSMGFSFAIHGRAFDGRLSL